MINMYDLVRDALTSHAVVGSKLAPIWWQVCIVLRDLSSHICLSPFFGSRNRSILFLSICPPPSCSLRELEIMYLNGFFGFCNLCGILLKKDKIFLNPPACDMQDYKIEKFSHSIEFHQCLSPYKINSSRLITDQISQGQWCIITKPWFLSQWPILP